MRKAAASHAIVLRYTWSSGCHPPRVERGRGRGLERRPLRVMQAVCVDIFLRNAVASASVRLMIALHTQLLVRRWKFVTLRKSATPVVPMALMSGRDSCGC